MKIYLYDETAHAEMHTALSSPIGEYEIDGVGISTPSGVIRLHNAPRFTHFKCEIGGVEYIFQITSIASKGGILCEYSYTIDYLKDYVNKYGLTDQDIVIERSTSQSKWLRMVYDRAFPTTCEFTYDYTQCGTVNFAIMLVVNYSAYTTTANNSFGSDVYLIPLNLWANVQSNLFKPMTSVSDNSTSQAIIPEYITNAIKGVYIIPFDDFNTGTSVTLHGVGLQNVSSIRIWGKVEGSDTVKTLEVNTPSIYRVDFTNTVHGFYVDAPAVSVPQVNDWRDVELTKRCVYIPLYSTVEINPQNFEYVKYYISPFDGTLSVSLDHESEILQPQPLPEISWVSDTTITQQRILNARTNSNVLQNVVGGAISLAVTGLGVASGGVGVGIGALASGGMISNVAQSLIQQQSESDIINMQALNYATATGSIGLILSTMFMITISTAQVLSITEYAMRNGLYCNYKIGEEIDSEFKGKRCWLNVMNSRLRGTEWYTNAVRNTLHNKCVIID